MFRNGLLLASLAGAALEVEDGYVSLLQSGASFRRRSGELGAEAPEDAAPTPAPRSSIHDVVGDDGVLMITLDNSKRRSHATIMLESAGIYPTMFPATDVKGANRTDLAGACMHHSDPGLGGYCGEQNGRKGEGCQTHVEQAITDSHRKALFKAQARDREWTAIIEDDAVPVDPERFSEAFKNAWAKVGPETKMVRLGWCTFEVDRGPIEYRDYVKADDAMLVSFAQWTNWYIEGNPKMYYVGGCTTGYMVHKDFIPEMLGIFPCCSPIDACLSWQLFFGPGHGDQPWDPRGHQIMVSLDVVGSRAKTDGFATFNQSGILAQDNRGYNSSRPEWNTTVDDGDEPISLAVHGLNSTDTEEAGSNATGKDVSKIAKNATGSAKPTANVTGPANTTGSEKHEVTST